MRELRIKITSEHAEELLRRLPGGRDFYIKIAEAFLRKYLR